MTAISWKSPVNGDWSLAANWSTGVAPILSDDVIISASGPYTVTISSIDLANSLTFNAPQAALVESAGELLVDGALTVNSGFVSLNEANAFSNVAITGGTLAFVNTGALAAGAVVLNGGELLATANVTLNNALSILGPSTIAAAHGTTLNENSTGYAITANTTVNIGSAGQDGTVLWHTNAATVVGIPVGSLNVQGGAFKAADAEFSFLLTNVAQTTVDSGASIDLAGFSTTIFDLLGAGVVMDSGAPTTLTLGAANFSGAISGPLSLVPDGAIILSGANTYTGTTTIKSGDRLQLGVGGATGSLGGGAISDGGTLSIDVGDAVTLTGVISGAGALQQIGTGVTSINTANTYAGGTILSAGTLAIGNGAALGTGTLTVSNGELLGTASATFANTISLSTSGATATIAAAPGATLSLTGALTLAGANTIDIGAPGQNGDILWKSTLGGTETGDKFDVLDGALTAGNSELEIALSAISGTTVEAGATPDWAGNVAVIQNLQGAGTVTNSGAAQTMTLKGATNFSGAISGALSLVFDGDASLSGVEEYTGGATLNGPFTLANTGTYDLVANSNIIGSAASLFVNNGLFEKTGGGAVSDVTSNFINNGALNVLSGSIEFSGGFTNNGVIHGLVTQSGAVTTISAAAPSDFNGDSHSDILWQNASGQASIWDMNGNTLIGGGAVNPNPGPSWTEIGTGDFNGDGHADILWQNTSTGQVSIWEMNGNTLVGGGPVNPNPGPAWKAIGTGDFKGDGLSDILFQNTMSGQVSIWEMNGNKLVGGGPVSPNPGLAWKAVGTGDFTDDGHSDILFQNTTSGQVSIWEMNGNSLIGGGTVSANLGPDWQAIGTGDFNDDGHSDILFQNTTSGQVSIQEMNGTNVIGGGTISANPGLSWHAIGTGDFNGDGHSDILFQNTNGQAMVWEMNGTNVIGGGAVSPNPGSNWRAVA